MESEERDAIVNNTVYVVSGFMRTGTSMMMKALEVGGMNACYKQSRDIMKNHFADGQYDPNIGGLYELERRDYLEWGFPGKYKGKLIKCLWGGLIKMDVMPKIKIVFMRRNPEEIRQSYLAFFGKNLENADKIDRNLDYAIRMMKNRKDVDIDVFWYRDVVERPREHFQILKNHGWPIDVDKCVEIVNPKYCRYKIENLVIGIK